MTSRLRAIGLSGAVLLALIATSERSEAHKPMTSKYTYNDDVFPILRDKCGRCHVDGGIAPMSLMTYKDALPWNESVRAEIIAGHMPPMRGLTAREMDTVLTWAAGGNSEGGSARTPQPVTLTRDWPLGAPDLVLPLPVDASLPSGMNEDARAFTIPTGTTEPRWIRAADLLPGTPSMVRNAVITVRSHGTVLAVWTPGDDPVPAPRGTAFLLPAGAELDVWIHYKKIWKDEGKTLVDRSRIGLYFAGPAPGSTAPSELRSLTLAPAAGAPGTFNRVLDEDVQAVAIYPDATTANATLDVTAVAADGTRTGLGHVVISQGWVRRYWFERPIILRRNTRLEVVAKPNAADLFLPPAAAPVVPATPANRLPLEVTLDVVAPGIR